VEERHDLDATGGGLQMTAVTTDKVSLVGGEPQATQTVQVPDGAGNLNVIFVDMTKSNNANAIEVQIGPSKPK
jgi:predicted O-methyltransferase YrrM